MSTYNEFHELVITGQKQKVAELTAQFLESGHSAKEILEQGLIPGMAVVGDRFEAGEYFIPEMLLAARSLNAGLDLLKPLLEHADVKPVAKVVIGTVKGDIHDIGKNLVGVMLRGGGFEVIDAGIDVPPERFVELVKETQAELLGLSALLTTTMPAMQSVVQAFEESDMRAQVKILIGGAPITEEYARKIGVDGTATNASAAVKLAKSLVGAA